jgi:putative ABC transport system ATP-binding protein
MTDIIRVRELTKHYVKDSLVVPALQGVDLALKEGDFAAVAGPSGSGKTTLLNLIGGLDRPTAGSVEVEGRLLNELSEAERTRLRCDRIGFVFQAHNLFPVLTALENAEYVLMLQGRPKDERRDIVRTLLKDVGLEGLENRFPRELSGGQQQRVAIARAVAARPAIVLADEPTANVDARTAVGILDLMKQLNEEKRVTMLFSSHDPEVLKRSEKVFFLRDGRISGLASQEMQTGSDER